MRKFVNGRYLDMTEEDVMEIVTDDFAIPTTEERLKAMEMAFMEFVEAMCNG